MNIEKMTMDNYEEVYNLWLSSEGMGLNNLDDSREGIEKFLNRNPETCFAARADGRIIGAILVGNDGRRGYIYHTAVHPDFRGKGFGKALVEEALTALDKLGINKAALVVFENNKTGNAFWAKLGFGTRDDLIYRNKAIKDFERIDT